MFPRGREWERRWVGGGADTRTLTTHLLESEIPHDEGKILSEALRDDL